MTSRHRSRLFFFSLSLSLSRIREKRTYRPHRCPQCDGGIDLKVHSCFHNAVSVPTFKLPLLPVSLSLSLSLSPSSDPSHPTLCNPWHAVRTAPSMDRNDAPVNTERPIRLCLSISSHFAQLFSLVRPNVYSFNYPSI